MRGLLWGLIFCSVLDAATNVDQLISEIRDRGLELIHTKSAASMKKWESLLEKVQIAVNNIYPGFMGASLLEAPTQALKRQYLAPNPLPIATLESLMDDISDRQQRVAQRVRADSGSSEAAELARAAGTVAQFTLSMLLTAVEDLRQDRIAADKRSPIKKFFDTGADAGKKFFTDIAEKVVEKTAKHKAAILRARIAELITLSGSDYENLMNDLRKFAQQYALRAIHNDQDIRNTVRLLGSRIQSTLRDATARAAKMKNSADEKAKKAFGDGKYPYELYAQMWERIEGLARG